MNGTLQYGGTFSDNNFLVGQTGCGKTSFVQSLGRNKIFGDSLRDVDWVSKIILTKSREDEIRDCFDYTMLEFHYPDDLSDFDILIETFQKDTLNEQDDTVDKEQNNCSIFREKKKFDRLIVMDDVSGLADKSNNFSNFLKVSQKFGYTCVCICHIIYPTKSIWQMILWQTKIFNIFPSAI